MIILEDGCFKSRRKKPSKMLWKKYGEEPARNGGRSQQTDTDLLKEILGELWTSIDRLRWGSYSFSKLSKEDVISLVAQGKYIKNKHAMTDDDVRGLDAILSKTI